MLAKVRAQEDKPWDTDARGLLDVALPIAPRQGHVWGMTQEDKAFPQPLGAQGLLGPRVSPWS
jgi:hypothetical protein